MKRLLIILGTITLIGTSTTSLVACNTQQAYKSEELAKLKEENKINTANQEIRDNLEWIAPQEKPFIDAFIDNKYYYVVWRNEKDADWRITKFKNNKSNNNIKIDEVDNRTLEKNDLGMAWKDLYVLNKTGFIKYVIVWKYDEGTYFKSLYRWNLDTKEPDLVINDNGNLKVKGE